MSKTQLDIGTWTPAELDSLQKSREFRACSAQQKAFVLDLLQSGDARHAVEVAYPKAAPACRRSLQWQVLRSDAVTAALEFWKWRNTESARTTLLEICRQQLAAAEPGSTAAKDFMVQLERLTIGIKGTNKAHFVDPLMPSIEEPQPPVKNADPASRVPPGATPLVDAQGIVRGYKTQAGEYVQLADVEVSK